MCLFAVLQDNSRVIENNTRRIEDICNNFEKQQISASTVIKPKRRTWSQTARENANNDTSTKQRESGGHSETFASESKMSNNDDNSLPSTTTTNLIASHSLSTEIPETNNAIAIQQQQALDSKLSQILTMVENGHKDVNSLREIINTLKDDKQLNSQLEEFQELNNKNANEIIDNLSQLEKHLNDNCDRIDAHVLETSNNIQQDTSQLSTSFKQVLVCKNKQC